MIDDDDRDDDEDDDHDHDVLLYDQSAVASLDTHT
jgi:hypothetical protein